MLKRAATLLALLLAAAAPAPIDPEAFAWRTATGATLPLSTPLRDEAGHPFALSQAFGAKPVILDLGYFHCPSLCGVVRSDVFGALERSGLRPDQYTFLAVTIDPSETPQDAAAARAADRQQSPFLAQADAHYLTGPPTSLAAIQQAVGFRARYDAAYKQFLHPAGIVVLTSGGVVSAYLLGVGYAPTDLRAAVIRASTGGIAQAAVPVLLLCFHYDAATGQYTLAIEKVLRLAGAITVLGIGALVFVLHRRSRRA